MLKKPWLTVQFTSAHASVVETMMGNISNSLPVFLNLTPEDKAACMKAGNAQLGMLKQIVRICKKHPEVMPRYHDLQEFYNVSDSVENLLSIRESLISALEGVENSLTGAVDDGLRMGMDYYHSIKRAAKTSNKPGLRKHWMAIRNNFLHETGQTPEEAMPEDDGLQEGDTGDAKAAKP